MSEVNYNGSDYYLMCKTDDIKNVFVRKIVVKDGKNYYQKLDSDLEFDEVMALFVEKNKDLLNM